MQSDHELLRLDKNIPASPFDKANKTGKVKLEHERTLATVILMNNWKIWYSTDSDDYGDHKMSAFCNCICHGQNVAPGHLCLKSFLLLCPSQCFLHCLECPFLKHCRSVVSPVSCLIFGNAYSAIPPSVVSFEQLPRQSRLSSTELSGFNIKVGRRMRRSLLQISGCQIQVRWPTGQCSDYITLS